MRKFILFISFLILSEFSIAQTSTIIPQYILEAKNFDLVNSNKLVFDLIFTHTDSIPLQLAGWQFVFRAPQTLGNFPAGMGAGSSFNLDTINGIPASDLPVIFRPRNGNTVASENSPGNYEFRLVANPLPGAGNGLIIPSGVPLLIGKFYMRSATPIDISVLNVNSFIIRDSCEWPLSVTRTKMHWYNENNFYQEFTRCASHIVNTVLIPPDIELTIKLTIEGLYDPVSDVSRKKDTVTAYLRNINSPYQVVDSSKSIIDSISHTGNFVFLNQPTGQYYFSVKNNKILETWNQSGGNYFIRGINSYDFTSSASKAYGNNMVLKGNRYCIYSGNFNNDNIIDADDLSLTDNDLYNFAAGDALTNINGDDIVDLEDLVIVDRNVLNLVLVQWPGLIDKRQILKNKITLR